MRTGVKITAERPAADRDVSGKNSGPWEEASWRMRPDTSRRQVPQKEDRSMARRLGFQIQNHSQGDLIKQSLLTQVEGARTGSLATWAS